MSGPTPDQLRFILESGILAPSADNHHRFRFEIADDALKVWYTDSELPIPGGYKRALAMLSLGAVAENLAIASSRYSIEAVPDLFPDPAQINLIFQIKWQISTARPDSLWEAIPQRHTNRRMIFRGPKMPPQDQSLLKKAACTLPSCSLHWMDEAPLRTKALSLISLAESERFHNQLLHKELFSAIRFTVGWRTSCDEGLPPGSLGIEPPLRPAFALLRHWSLMRLINLIGGYHLLGWRAAYLPCRFTPHLAIIAVEQTDDLSIFNAGRTLQRLWLAITQLGLSLQPLPASALYALEGAPLEGIPASLQHDLQRGWQAIMQKRHPLMVLRIGRAPPPTLCTSRKPLNYYTQDID